MRNYYLSESVQFMVGVGWIEFNKTPAGKLKYCCDNCCLRDTGRCYEVKCSPIERIDSSNGYFTIIPKWRIKAAKKLVRWFGL